MKYFIHTLEKKTTSTGKVKLDTELRDEQGQIVKGVSIWQDFPEFQSITFGAEVNGDLVPAKDPKYGPTLYPAKNFTTIARTSRPSAISAAQEKKAEHIAHAQENKEQGIKVSSTMRMAVDLAIAERSVNEEFPEKSEFTDRILFWRKWLWKTWDVNGNDMPPF